MSDTGALQAELYERLEGIDVDDLTEDEQIKVISRMYELVDDPISDDALRIYKRLLLDQKGVDKINVLTITMQSLTLIHNGPISQLISQEMLDRVAAFELALSQEGGGHYFYSNVRSDHKIERYLEITRSAVAVSDNDTLSYVIGNLESVLGFVKDRDVNDPAVLITALRMMQDGSSAVVSGAL